MRERERLWSLKLLETSNERERERLWSLNTCMTLFSASFIIVGDYIGFDEEEPTSRSGGKPKVVAQLKQKHKTYVVFTIYHTQLTTHIQGTTILSTFLYPLPPTHTTFISHPLSLSLSFSLSLSLPLSLSLSLSVTLSHTHILSVVMIGDGATDMEASPPAVSIVQVLCVYIIHIPHVLGGKLIM